MLKVEIDRASVRSEFDIYLQGSLRAGTVKAGVTEFRTELSLDSEAPMTKLEKVIRAAKSGCFAEQLVKHPVPLKSTVLVNGAAFGDWP